MAVSTCSEGSIILLAGFPLSDTEQHRVMQQMQQCFPTIRTSVLLNASCGPATVLAAKKLRPASLQHAGSWPPLKQLASRVGCPNDALLKAQGLQVSQSSLPLSRCHTPCKAAVHCLAGVQVQAAKGS